MLNNLRRMINILIFILLAPLIGYEETARELSRGGHVIDKLFLRAAEDLSRGARRRDIEYELVEAARCYECSGMSHDTYFEYLYNYVSLKLEDVRRSLPEYYIAVLTCSVGVSLASIMLLIVGGALSALTVYVVASVAMIFLVHQVQPQVARYRYHRPLAVAVVILVITMLLRLPVELCVTLSCMGAAVLLLPEILETWRTLLNSQGRLIVPFLELLWSTSPTPIRERTLLEKELKRVWEYGYNIGAPWFVARLCRLITTLIHTIKYYVRTGLVYSPFIAGSYILLVLLAKTLLLGMFTAKIPIVVMISKGVLQILLLLQGVLTGLLAGKVAHSLGMSTLTIPLMMITKLIIIGPTVL